MCLPPDAGQIPRENELRATAILEHVLAHPGDLLAFARRRLLSRWQRLEAAFAGSRTFRLEPRDTPTADTYSGAAQYEASPAYAWIEKLGGGDATAALEVAGVRGRAGDKFGAGVQFVRLELLMREETFDLMLEKLAAVL